MNAKQRRKKKRELNVVKPQPILLPITKAVIKSLLGKIG